MEERLVELESKMAFQELALSQLSEAYAGQQRQLELLEKTVRELISQVRGMQSSIVANESEETPPPHY
jgi:SlyX protein